MLNAVVLILIALLATSALAQPADTAFVNGKILTGDSTSTVHQALAVRDGRILAVGTNADVRRLSGKSTRLVDLQGRSVVPGLVDSHMHAIRAALSFATEVNWIGAASLEEALNRVRDSAKRAKIGRAHV